MNYGFIKELNCLAMLLSMKEKDRFGSGLLNRPRLWQ